MSDNEFKIDKKISNDDKLYYDYSNESNSIMDSNNLYNKQQLNLKSSDDTTKR